MINISALWRGQRRKKEFSSDIVPAREVSPADASRFEAILQLPGIAEKQDAFEELQWNCLEELSCQEGFTFDALVLYALQLRLLEDLSASLNVSFSRSPRSRSLSIPETPSRNLP